MYPELRFWNLKLFCKATTFIKEKVQGNLEKMSFCEMGSIRKNGHISGTHGIFLMAGEPFSIYSVFCSLTN